MEQAKKYKSADEFIKELEKKGEIVYHGTNQKFDKFDINKVGSKTDEGIIGKGIYLTTNRKFAKGYAKDHNDEFIINVFINNAKIFDLHNLKTKKAFAEKIGMKEHDLYQTRDGLIIPKDFKSANKFGIKLKEMGYDGASFKRSEGTIETVIYNVDTVKTETQLKEIWEQAHSK